MSGFDRLIAKFWGAAPARLETWLRLVRLAETDAAARAELRLLIHAMKGEAQMLEIALATDLLERADTVAKLTDETYLLAHAMRALLAVAAVLGEMSRGEAPQRLAETLTDLDTLVFSPERIIGSRPSRRE